MKYNDKSIIIATLVMFNIALDSLVEFIFHNKIKVLEEYKEKAHRELCRVRDEQKTFGKIKVNTEL